ncbi:glycosyltransferase [Synechococcus sp. RSCCF101]|uniref:glycosyltransferase n=1 Tax=Synechococcus sp. RSCCF101 TaxID=2511069 RepID=UPI0012444389|nr:glycosyltransferase [Synechococcus sp. RSCCF101]QEY31939.1 glycosyltransferase [Synechococcus sp. RSCCF101]
MHIVVATSIYRQPLWMVQQAIASVRAQTHQDLSLILRIDGPGACGEDLGRWLQDEAARDRRLTVLVGRRNLGNFGSLNRMLRQAEAEAFAQLDGDDVLDPQALALCAEALREHPSCSFVYSRYEEIDQKGALIGQGDRSLTPYSPLASLVQFIPFHLRLVRMSSYRAIGGYRAEFPYAGDYDLSLRLAEIGDVAHLPRTLYRHRLHTASASSVDRQRTVAEAYAVAREALYRRGWADRFRLQLNFDGRVSLHPQSDGPPDPTGAASDPYRLYRVGPWAMAPSP